MFKNNFQTNNFIVTKYFFCFTQPYLTVKYCFFLISARHMRCVCRICRIYMLVLSWKKQKNCYVAIKLGKGVEWKLVSSASMTRRPGLKNLAPMLHVFELRMLLHVWPLYAFALGKSSHCKTQFRSCFFIFHYFWPKGGSLAFFFSFFFCMHMHA